MYCVATAAAAAAAAAAFTVHFVPWINYSMKVCMYVEVIITSSCIS